MNIYDLPLGTKILHISTQQEGTVTKIHPSKNFRYQWYTVTFKYTNRYVKTWMFPKLYLVIINSWEDVQGNPDSFTLQKAIDLQGENYEDTKS